MESQDNRCGERGWEKGNRRAKAITEAFLFDGLSSGAVYFILPTPLFLAFLTATSIKAGVGSRIGPPTRGPE